MSKELALPARCNLCDQTFYGPRLTFVGRPHGRQPQFLEQLAQHIFTDHKDVAEGIALGAGEYQGMFIMSQFSTDDPELVNQLDIARWNVHQKTLKMRVSDQMIADCVAGILPDVLTMAQMGDTEGLTRNLTGLLMSMREKLEEPNKYILTGQLAADPALVV
jgi:hypothetical protein